MKSKVGPAISADLLPIVLEITSWIYVLSVCMLTLMIMIGAMIIQRPVRTDEVNRENKLSYDIAYVIIILIWIVCCHVFGFGAQVIPPILVVIYETLYRENVAFLQGFNQFVLLTLAAFIGSSMFLLMPEMPVLVGMLDLIAVFLLTQILKLRLPPAFAISLLPFVLPKLDGWELLLAVFLSSFILLLIVNIYRKIERNARNKKQRLSSST